MFFYAIYAPPNILEEQEQTVIIPENITNEMCTVSFTCYPPTAEGVC